MIVKYYRNFSIEHEQALFKTAAATAASIDGEDYDLDMISAVGGDYIERGALDFCDDYIKEYPEGRYKKQIFDLKNKIFSILAYRIYNAGRVYSKLGYDEAAKIQYLMTIKTYDDKQKYPLCTQWIEKAKDELESLGISDYTKDEYWLEISKIEQK